MATAIGEHVFTDTGLFATSGAFTLNGNWLSGTAPISGEEVVILTPDFDIITFPTAGTVDLGAFTVSELCTKKIGASGDRMDVDVADVADSAGAVIFRGAGTTNYFECNTNFFVIDHLSKDPTSLFIKHRTSAIGDLWMRNGAATLDGGSYTRIVVNSIAGPSSKLIIEAGSILVTVIVVNGIVECSATDTITTLDISENGQFDHLVVQPITTLNMYGGIFNFDGLSTITEINQWGGTVDASRTGGNKVVTVWNGHGGRLVPPTGGGLSVGQKNFSPSFDRGGF